MARRRRRRSIAILRFLWKRRFFIIMLLLLGGIGWGSVVCIRAYEAYTKGIAALEQQLNEVDFSKDPARWTGLQRQLDFQKVEPMFYGLLILILCALGAVLITSIINARGVQRETSSDSWLPEMRRKREEHRQRDQ